MTYWSRIWRISRGVGRSDLAPLPPLSEAVSSRMMSLQSSMHSSQMNTDGPAMSLRTSCWLLPQNEQYRSLPSSCLPRESSDMDGPQQVSANQSFTVIGSVAGVYSTRRHHAAKTLRPTCNVGRQLQQNPISLSYLAGVTNV